MKKLLLLLTVLLAFNCSKDDDSNDNQDGFTFLYKESCDSSTNNKICTTQEVYDEAMQNKIYIDELCFKIKIDNVWYIWDGGYNFCD